MIKVYKNDDLPNLELVFFPVRKSLNHQRVWVWLLPRLGRDGVMGSAHWEGAVAGDWVLPYKLR
jgi:hypothetical protein